MISKKKVFIFLIIVFLLVTSIVLAIIFRNHLEFNPLVYIQVSSNYKIYLQLGT